MGHDAKLNPFSKESAAIISKDPAVTKDFMGRELQVGDQLILSTAQPIIFQVLQVQPFSAPGMPPGILAVDVIGRQRFLVGRNKNQPEFLRVAEAKDAPPITQPTEAEVEAAAPGPEIEKES